MFKSHLRIALRHIWSKKNYSLLNYLCLTFGLSCAVIVVLYIFNVLSYDKFHKNYDRLYAVEAYVTYFNGDRFPKQYLSSSLTRLLSEQAPEIEEMVRIADKDYSFIIGDKTINENGIFADDRFFDVFSFPLINAGNKVLDDLKSIAISESMAIKFFQSTDCIGKTLVVTNDNKPESFRISGVFRDVPHQSFLQFDFVLPFEKFLSDNSWANDPGATANSTWVLLKKNADYRFVEKKIKNLISGQEATLNQELFLFPMKEQILYSYAAGRRVWKGMQNLVIAGSVGFAILLISCFNFINLAIAMNFSRYREAGIRKAAGAGSHAIVFQFLGETFILVVISLFSSIILTKVLLIGFNTMFSYDVQLRMLDPAMIVFLISVTLFTGLISGLLPGLYLASVNPVDAVKGKVVKGHSFSLLRQSLIVFQFTIPLVLIIFMMIIRTQDKYMRNYDAGLDKEKVIVLNNSDRINSHSGSVKSDLLTIPGIDAVTFTNCIPTRGAKVSSDVSWEGKDPQEKLHFWAVNTDFDYNKIVNLKLTGGRFFDPAFSTDSESYLINDVAAKVIKNSDPVGSAISLDGHKGTIIGVFKDFHAIDLAGPYTPTIIRISNNENPHIMIRYSAGTYKEIAYGILEVFKKYDPETVFNANLFRDLPLYSDLSLPSRLTGIAFVIALLLACMGLYGLASFTSENRTREIAIRKVNGAITASLLRLLLKGYSRWLLISFLIAIPIAYAAGKMFLGRFYFHSSIPIWAFIAGPAIGTAVAFFTVIFQTKKAATRNPVVSLRAE